MLGGKVNSVKMGWLAGLFVCSSVSSNWLIYVTDYFWDNLVLYSSTLVMRGWESHYAASSSKLTELWGNKAVKKKEKIGNIIVQISTPTSHWGTLFPNCWPPNSHSLLLHATYCSVPGKEKKTSNPHAMHVPSLSPRRVREIKQIKIEGRNACFSCSHKSNNINKYNYNCHLLSIWGQVAGIYAKFIKSISR